MWLWIFIFGVINEKPYMKKLELLICLVMFMIASAKADVIESELQKSRMDNGFIACTSIVKKDCFRFNHNTKSMQTINFNNTKKPLASTDEYVGANDSYFNPNSTTFDKNAIVNFNITNYKSITFTNEFHNQNILIIRSILANKWLICPKSRQKL